MEGSSGSQTETGVGTASGLGANQAQQTTTKMVENGSPQQMPAAPAVPESDEATTTNPSMNGLEAHFPTSGQTTTTSATSTSSSSPTTIPSPHGRPSASTTTNANDVPVQGPGTTTSSPLVESSNSNETNLPINTLLGAALSMEEAAAQDAASSQAKQESPRDPGDHGSAGSGALATTTSGKTEEKRVGCAHYKRRAKFVTPCCNKLYMCRYCHDEKETHYFNRKTVTQLICTECDTRQRVQAECEKCGARFGKYTCLVCNLFDDEDKNQYHCHGCGICRVGGRDRFFHCEVCNMCLPMQLKIDGHRCVENVSRSNCPVCLDDIHTSRIPCHIPDCGHLIHRTCFEELLSSGHYACPTCQTSMIDMKKLWDYLDAEVENSPMPKEYENYFVDILCKDCHKESNIPYHVVGLKCSHCGAYNTCQTKRTGGSGTAGELGGLGGGGGGGSAGHGGSPPPPPPPPGMTG